MTSNQPWFVFGRSLRSLCHRRRIEIALAEVSGPPVKRRNHCSSIYERLDADAAKMILGGKQMLSHRADARRCGGIFGEGNDEHVTWHLRGLGVRHRE